MNAQQWERGGKQALILPDEDGLVTLPLPVVIDLLHAAGWRPVPPIGRQDDTGHPRTTEL